MKSFTVLTALGYANTKLTVNALKRQTGLCVKALASKRLTRIVLVVTFPKCFLCIGVGKKRVVAKKTDRIQRCFKDQVCFLGKCL